MFKQVLKPDQAEGQIISYTPRSFNQEVPKQALSFAKSGEHVGDTGFAINELVAESTGLGDLERANFKSRLENEVLTRLKTVEEKAYAEAYALGLQDGRQKAFEDGKAEIQAAIGRLAEITATLSECKTRLLVENERHIVETVFHLAKNLALREIKENGDVVLDVLKKALENAQHEEELTIKINPKDNEFLEMVKKEVGHPLERVPRLRIELNEGITPGGCILETNYGVIDATVEQRIEKLWKLLESKVPKVEGGA